MFKHVFKINKETKHDKIDNDRKDHHQLENIDYIYEACDQIKWEMTNKSSNILILTMEIDSNKRICSLNNADSSQAYSHLCQYS